MPDITIINLGILIVGTVAILIIIRSAKDMTNQALIRSESFFKLVIALIKRHWIAFISVNLILAGMFFRLKFIGVLIDLILLIIAYQRAFRWTKIRQHHVNYVRSIKPDRRSKSFPVKLGASGTSQLGNRDINYMFLNLHDKTITFPEANYQVNSSYYLLNVVFKPKYGPRYNRLTYRRPFTIRGHSSNDNHMANIVEIPSTAIVELMSTDASRVIQVKLHNEISDVVNHLKKRYVLNEVERHDVGLD